MNRDRAYPYLPLDVVEQYVGQAEQRRVSRVARSPEGFLPQYRHARGQGAALDPWWQRRRRNFVKRHMAQAVKHGEAFFDARGRPSRRHLALIMWAYSPTPSQLGAEDMSRRFPRARVSARRNPVEQGAVVRVFQDNIAAALTEAGLDAHFQQDGNFGFAFALYAVLRAFGLQATIKLAGDRSHAWVECSRSSLDSRGRYPGLPPPGRPAEVDGLVAAAARRGVPESRLWEDERAAKDIIFNVINAAARRNPSTHAAARDELRLPPPRSHKSQPRIARMTAGAWCLVLDGTHPDPATLEARGAIFLNRKQLMNGVSRLPCGVYRAYSVLLTDDGSRVVAVDESTSSLKFRVE